MRALFTATLVCGALAASTQASSAQPSVGGGGADVSVAPGGANVTIQGSYVEIPSASPGSGGSPGASSAGTGGGGAGYSGGGDVVAAPTGPPVRQQLKACGRFMECVPLSPDVGMSATPPAMAEIMNTVGIAITGMQLEKPPMCWTPEPADFAGGRTGLVGKFGWAFYCPNQIREANMGPVSRVATTGMVTVSANAVNTGVLINWGDSSVPTFCAGALLPFTPYTDLVDASPLTPPSGLPSPTCGHHIEKTSINEPSGVFNVTATSNFVVTWTAIWPGGTVGGVTPVPLTSTYQQRIGELQVLVTPN
ncbi:hypothetical protein FXW78_50060 [Rhodococcus opacus]|nr:hypothetical protein [Rhodococcus opacus]